MHNHYFGGKGDDEEQQGLITSEDTGNANTDPVDFPFLSTPVTRPIWFLPQSTRRLRYPLFCFLITGIISLLFLLYSVTISHLGYYDFVFDGPRPDYLSATVPKPLIIRLAIISRVDGYKRRQILRDLMLTEIPSTYARIEYKFFLGHLPGSGSNTSLNSMLEKENMMYGDLEILEAIDDIPQRISEKRFAALKWTAQVAPDDYDYSMTLDSDSFCSFRTLSQRLQLIYADLDPRKKPVLIGNMGSQAVYWENTVGDGTNDSLAEDIWVGGPRYPYPVGIGYMFSSNLAATIASADPAIPHHIHYPYDDVMIGSWVSGLRAFPDTSKNFFRTIDADPAVISVRPRPYVPYVVDTRVVDDKLGWHDFKNRGAVSRQRSIGWDTACVHRIKNDEVRKLRKIEEFRTGWD